MVLLPIDVQAELTAIQKASSDPCVRMHAYAVLAKRIAAQHRVRTRQTAETTVPIQKQASAQAQLQALADAHYRQGHAGSPALALDHVILNHPDLYRAYLAEFRQTPMLRKAQGGTTFETLVASRVAKGTDAAEAFAAVAQEHPEAYEAYRLSYTVRG